jgi:hypothetical protein
MGNFAKLSALIIVLALGGFGYYMYQSGLNPLDINDIKLATDSTKSKIDKISETISEKDIPAKESKVYKRKDAQGNWYYSNEPPKEGEEAEVMIYRSDTNLLPPLPEDNKKKK